MRPLVFLDLDDTILQTRAKCPPGAPVEPVATGREGNWLSFMTAGQRALFDWLDAAATVIPATARNVAAYRRVRLPFRHAAILNFGGTILEPGGEPDREWHARVSAIVSPLAIELEGLRAGLERYFAAAGIEARARVLGDFDLALYIVVKHPAGDLEAMARIQREHAAALADERFAVHANGNNISIVPRGIDKALAVRYLSDRYPGSPFTIGVGDSLSDAAFLAACDLAMIPRGSQLAAARLGALP